jgi:serine/threonine-protein kinase RsbW
LLRGHVGHVGPLATARALAKAARCPGRDGPEQLMLSGPPAYRRAFPGESCQLRAVRQWVASLLPDCPARADVICVTTELAANAVLHTASGRDGHFEVGISWLDSAVRVTVSDSGSPKGPRRAGCLMAETGRGLLIVQALALKTGVTGDRTGAPEPGLA